MPADRKTTIIAIDPDRPEQVLIDEAVRILQKGGVIAYPTETFYALGADAGNAAAVERIFDIKGRPVRMPIALIVGKQEDIQGMAAVVSPPSRLLMQAFWPGALTLLFPAAAAVLPRLTAGTGKIGIRVSSHPIAAALARTLGRPLTSTSANLSGEQEASTAGQVNERLREGLDAIIDGGPTHGQVSSTILDVTGEPPILIREGAIPAAQVFAFLKKPQKEV